MDFYPNGVVGVKSLRSIASKEIACEFEGVKEALSSALEISLHGVNSWENLIKSFEEDKSGLIMTMGKGGVGKTTIASMIASELAKRGHKVTLSTTDPACTLSVYSTR